jgi:hypothetical protein
MFQPRYCNQSEKVNDIDKEKKGFYIKDQKYRDNNVH